MPTTVRLSKDIDDKLMTLAKSRNTTKSAIVTESLKVYLESHLSDQTPFEIGKALFGRHQSGRGDLAERHKTLIREKLHAKNRAKGVD
jgi:RHH-type transcriptional regulator, rel operon repressor / antitoxin RelB